MLRPFSIRALLAGALTVPVVVIAAVLVILSSVTAHRIAENLGEQLLVRAGDVVHRDMSKYLSSAVRISDLYTRRIEHGILPTRGGLQAWERPMLDDLVTSPDVASICFGNAQGDATWLLRNKGRLEVGRADGPRDNFTQEFVVDPSTGQIDTANPIRTYQYDPRGRPWYDVALRSTEPTWTPIYFWFGNAGGDLEAGSGYTRVIKDHQSGEVAGALVIDVTLGALSGFLKRLPLAGHGYIFVIDEQNQLVAASHGSVNSAEGKRLVLGEHDHPAARAIADLLSSDQGQAGPRFATHRIYVGDEPARLRFRSFDLAPGINWTIATIVPEHVFLADAKSVERQGIVMGLLASLVAMALGFMVSRTIAKPVLRLREHARRIGKGDFDTRLRLRAVRELDELCRDLNHMARDLKDREELRQSLALANEVQQSLLPQAPPRIRGLDIAGQSRYCETTGGDYYDFIDVAELPMSRTMVAVGDVMGHGIASALLMTTARAALRATALKEGSLGVLLSQVNQVLAKDARHGRFMTMALAVVDPEHGTLRWANAGHDEPIVFSPVRGEFRKLDGGDVPLGVMQNISYQEYCVTEVEPGSVIVIGTDGIWEAPNPQGERFGKPRLHELIRKYSGETAADISKAINEALITFCGKDCFPDDVTFVVVKLWLAHSS